MTSDELVAMLPVDRGMARKMAWAMPFPPLFERLADRSKGRILDLERGVGAERPQMTSEREWARFLSRATVTDDWIELRFEM